MIWLRQNAKSILLSAALLPTLVPLAAYFFSAPVFRRYFVQFLRRLDRAQRPEVDGPLILAAAMIALAAILLLLSFFNQVLELTWNW